MISTGLIRSWPARFQDERNNRGFCSSRCVDRNVLPCGCTVTQRLAASSLAARSASASGALFGPLAEVPSDAARFGREQHFEKVDQLSDTRVTGHLLKVIKLVRPRRLALIILPRFHQTTIAPTKGYVHAKNGQT